MRKLLRVSLISVLCASVGVTAEGLPVAAAAPPLTSQNAQMLYCGYWSYAVAPKPVPVGFESHFAVAVVEISSATEIDNVSVSDLSLFGEKGVAVANMQRLLKVDIFDEPYAAGESDAKYYLSTDPGGRTRPWDGTLPAGKIRLRASAAVVEDPVGVRGCRLTVGKYVIEGPVTFRMAT